MPTRAALALTVGVIAFAFPAVDVFSQIRAYDLDGPAVHVQVDEIALCVGRRFIEPNDLKRWNEGIRPVTAGTLYRRAVPLALFSQALTGYTDAHYRDGIAATYDKRKYPSDWVRVEVLPKASRRPIAVAPGDYQTAFDAEWVADEGFRSHKRRSDCVGQSVAWAALSAVTFGPECRDTEIKYGHPAAPEVVLYCNPKRCSTSNHLDVGDVSIEYDFPRGFLRNWAALHSGVLKRIADWRADRTCLK